MRPQVDHSRIWLICSDAEFAALKQAIPKRQQVSFDIDQENLFLGRLTEAEFVAVRGELRVTELEGML